tara:strand:- start:114 stop:467 length:354 start_codon:yes stop_codon:yes gene_type:complete
MRPIPIVEITETTPSGRFVDAAGSPAGHPVVEGVLARLRPWLPWVHVAMSVVFLAVLVGPVYLPESSEQATFLDDGRVLANYLLWGGVVSAGVFLGGGYRQKLVRLSVPDGGRLGAG